MQAHNLQSAAAMQCIAMCKVRTGGEAPCREWLDGSRQEHNQRAHEHRHNIDRAKYKGGVQTGGGVSRSGLVLPLLAVLFPFWDFPDFSGIFPICLGIVRGFSRFVLLLFLSLLTAPARNSPERVRNTIRAFPKKSGNPPVWKPTA